MLYRLDLKQANLAIIQLLSLLVSDLTYNMYNVLCIFLIWMSWFKELCVLNFEEKKNCVIQNAIITWTDICLEHVYFVFSILA
jgi:hypothetical protein